MNPLSLDSRIALVTGAAGGIGLATATRFFDEGATLLLCDLRPLGETDLAAGKTF